MVVSKISIFYNSVWKIQPRRYEKDFIFHWLGFISHLSNISSLKYSVFVSYVRVESINELVAMFVLQYFFFLKIYNM